jgi:hypothetical protein
LRNGLRLPSYVERNHRGACRFASTEARAFPLPEDPTTPEFRAAYSAALVDAIAMENSDE